MLLPVYFVSIVLLCYLCIDRVLLDSLSCPFYSVILDLFKKKDLFFLQNVTNVWYNKNMDETFCPLFLTDIDNCNSFDVKWTLFVKRSPTNVNVKPFKKLCFFFAKIYPISLVAFELPKFWIYIVFFFYAKRHWASLFLK